MSSQARPLQTANAEHTLHRPRFVRDHSGPHRKAPILLALWLCSESGIPSVLTSGTQGSPQLLYRATMSTRQKLLRITKYALGAGVAGVGGTLGGIRLWTRKTYFEEFTPDTDPLYHLPLLKKINPHNNPTLNDCCVRKIPYGQLKTDLLEDQKRGGEKLVNAFSQGMWGGYGACSFAPNYLPVSIAMEK